MDFKEVEEIMMLTASLLSELEDKIEDALDDGWKELGKTFHSNGTNSYCQVMYIPLLVRQEDGIYDEED